MERYDKFDLIMIGTLVYLSFVALSMIRRSFNIQFVLSFLSAVPIIKTILGSKLNEGQDGMNDYIQENIYRDEKNPP